jgi:hypothetical protein
LPRKELAHQLIEIHKVTNSTTDTVISILGAFDADGANQHLALATLPDNRLATVVRLLVVAHVFLVTFGSFLLIELVAPIPIKLGTLLTVGPPRRRKSNLERLRLIHIIPELALLLKGGGKLTPATHLLSMFA